MIGIRYSSDEKKKFLEDYRNSSLKIEEYVKKAGISEDNLKQWLKEDKDATFGKLNTNSMALEFSLDKTIVFRNENIKIELREGFDKEYLKKIVEVLVNDK